MKHLFLLAAAILLLAASNSTAQQRITMGQSMQGKLDAGSLKLDDGSSYDLYRYDSPGNETIVILMESADFDTYLSLGQLQDGAFTQLASDDDGAGGTNSRIEHRITMAGTYLIRANSLEAGEAGSYTLRLHRTTSSAPSATISVGQSLGAFFNSDSALLDDGSHFAEYTIIGVPGLTVDIILESNDFDTYLWIGTLTNGEFENIETNDDGEDEEDGTNSKITFTFADRRTYVIRANTYEAGETGAYTLRVLAAGTPRPR